MKLLFFILLLLLSSCTIKETIREKPIPYPVTASDTLWVKDSTDLKDSIIYAIKTDTLYKDTTIIKYYPKDSKFIIDRTNRLYEFLYQLNENLFNVEKQQDTILALIKEPIPIPEYSFLSKLGWAFIGVFVLGLISLLLIFAIRK